MESEELLHSVAESGYAVARFDGRVQAVTFYDADNDESALMSEVRAWRADQSLTQKQLDQLLSHWLKHPAPNAEYSLSTEDLRSISLTAHWRHITMQIDGVTRHAAANLSVPSQKEIDLIIQRNLIPNLWRNRRDFSAQARQLRGTLVYLRAVFTRHDSEPMHEVAESTGLDLNAARKLIEQARVRGYLSRTNGQLGGRLTDKAIEAIEIINQALVAAKKAK